MHGAGLCRVINSCQSASAVFSDCALTMSSTSSCPSQSQQTQWNLLRLPPPPNSPYPTSPSSFPTSVDMSGGFNPNAPTFSFQPGAGSFIPRTQQQQPGDQQQQQQPQGGYPSYGQYGQQQPYGQQPYGGYQAGYGGYQGGGGAYPQLAGGGYQGGYQGYQPQGGYQAPPSQGYQPPQVQARYASPSAASGGPSQAEQLAALPPKVLSLGGGGTAAGPPKPFVRKEATGPPAPAPSFSIGGPKTDKPKVISLGAKPTPTTAAPATAPKSASAAPTPPSSTAATAGTSAATTPSATRSNTPAATASPATSEIATPAAKKAEPSSTMNVYSRQAASTTADGVLAEAQKHLDEDVLKDLYGGKSEDTNAKEHMSEFSLFLALARTRLFARLSSFLC